MIITGKNYIEDFILTCTSEAENQDINNLKIPQLSKNFTMTPLPDPIDCEATHVHGVHYDFVVIDRGSMSATASVALQVKDTSTGQFADVDLLSTETCFYYNLTLIENRKDWNKFSFTADDAGYPVSIGYIFIGDYLQLPSINQNSVLYYTTTTQKTSSISGQQYTDAGYQTVSTIFDFPRVPDSSESFLGTVVAGRKQILAAWRETELQYSWLFPWEQSLADVPPIFGSVEGDGLSFDRISGEGKYWHMALSFREVK